MSVTFNDSSINVLRLWRDVEIFNVPTAPKQKNEQTRRVRYFNQGQPLPWQNHRDALVGTKTHEWVHSVFIGVTDVRSWVTTVMRSLCPQADLNDAGLNELAGNGWIGAFVVNECGTIFGDTYVPASFALGFRALHDGRSLDGLSDTILNECQNFLERYPLRYKKPEDGASSPPTNRGIEPISWLDLNRELQHLLLNFGENFRAPRLSIVIQSNLRRRPQGNKKQEVEDSNIEFLNSFYLNDLDRLITLSKEGQPFGAALSQYLGADSSNLQRDDVLKNTQTMTACLLPQKLPMGRWPASSHHHLMLAQQVAVNEIISQLGTKSGLIAVNGPPGTGKTTLLCDVIAEVVVDRARRLCKLDNPSALFEDKTIVGGREFFPLRDEIVNGTGIVVTSNNNTAVENITRELPAVSKLAGKEHPEATYFKEVAEHMFKKANINIPAWGLIAAALGNSSNRRLLASVLQTDPEQNLKSQQGKQFIPGMPCSMTKFLHAAHDDAHTEWLDAKHEFLELFKKVDATRQDYIKLNDELLEIAHLHSQHTGRLSEIEKTKTALHHLDSLWVERQTRTQEAIRNYSTELVEAQEREQIAKLEAQTASDRLEIAQASQSLTLWDRFLSMIGLKSKRYVLWHQATHELRSRRANANETWVRTRDIVGRVKKIIDTCQTELRDAEKIYTRNQSTLTDHLNDLKRHSEAFLTRLQQVDSKLQGYKNKGVVIPDNKFFEMDQTTRHLSSTWVDPEFDALRAKLFLAALRLHEATLLADKAKAINNLDGVCNMLNRCTAVPLNDAERPLLWNMLFFMIPVVSSTLASFERLFTGMKSESIGWLLIDEAGQATPQSVAGALWRSKRVVVIGDPLQIEPVMTVPGPIVSELIQKHGVNWKWSPATQSAQTLADRTMTLGAWIGKPSAEDGVWTGLPLRAHRRCIDPMFSVSNLIAYDNQMVQANTKPPKIECVLGDSAWFDVHGSNYNEQTVDEEIHALQKLLLDLDKNWPITGQDQSASLFVISPFKKVAQDCSKMMYDLGLMKRRPGVSSGTVHRFQGKEADIVIIVLGSKPGKAGTGSRSWASSKPNLLNVALTRAKHRVYVIGNHNDWSAHKYFKELGNVLTVYTMPNEPWNSDSIKTVLSAH